MTSQSKTQRLKKWLQSGKSITPTQAWFRLGIYRLSGLIFRLKRRDRLNIVTEKATQGKASFARYSMKK